MKGIIEAITGIIQSNKAVLICESKWFPEWKSTIVTLLLLSTTRGSTRQATTTTIRALITKLYKKKSPL